MTLSNRQFVVRVTLLGALGLLLTLPVLRGGSSARAAGIDRGLEIAREMERRDTGWVDSSATLSMRLMDRNGKQAQRSMRLKLLEVADDGDRSLIVFDEPRDVQGTALLTYSHRNGPDDQWLYMPALVRVKRISSNNRTGPFMGSEFSYEDLGSQEVERYTHKFLREEPIDKQPMYVIERRPVDQGSGYTRHVTWVDREYRVRRIVFYDRRDAQLKVLDFEAYKLYGKFWRAERMLMKNVQNGKATVLEWQNFRFKNGFPAQLFDANTLRNAR